MHTWLILEIKKKSTYMLEEVFLFVVHLRDDRNLQIPLDTVLDAEKAELMLAFFLEQQSLLLVYILLDSVLPSQSSTL